MSTSLRSTLSHLASSFADEVLQAVRSVSLDELLGSDAGGKSNGRASRSPSARAAAPAVSAPAAKKASRSSGRLQRRSPEDIAAALGRVIALVKKHKEGLRAEQIRSELDLQAKEMPRILKEGISRKNLKTKGQKRATTYFAS